MNNSQQQILAILERGRLTYGKIREAAEILNPVILPISFVEDAMWGSTTIICTTDPSEELKKFVEDRRPVGWLFNWVIRK